METSSYPYNFLDYIELIIFSVSLVVVLVSLILGKDFPNIFVIIGVEFSMLFLLIFLLSFCPWKSAILVAAICWAHTSLPVVFMWRSCLIKYSLLESVFITVTYLEFFYIILPSFVLKDSFSVFTHDHSGRSYLWGMHVRIMFVWLFSFTIFNIYSFLSIILSHVICKPPPTEY